MARRLSPQATAVLDALASDGAWLHGYELSRRTQVRPGTLYPLLERLASRGLLESRWEDAPEAGRPRRHAYRITAEGNRERVARAKVEMRVPARTRAVASEAGA